MFCRKGAKRIPGRTANSLESLTVMGCGRSFSATNGGCERQNHPLPPVLPYRRCPGGYVLDLPGAGVDDRVLEKSGSGGYFLPSMGPSRPQYLFLDSHGSHEILSMLDLAELCEGYHHYCPATSHHPLVAASLIGVFLQYSMQRPHGRISVEPCKLAEVVKKGMG